MPIFNSVPALLASLPAATRLAGIDLGDRRIGVAISDAGRRIASPAAQIARTKLTKTVAALDALLREREASGLVVGLPLEMDGREGRRVQATRDFVTEWLRRTDWPVAFWDERLSTAGVTRVMIEEADRSRAKRAAVVDAAAAGWILQGALDAASYGSVGSDDRRFGWPESEP